MYSKVRIVLPLTSIPIARHATFSKPYQVLSTGLHITEMKAEQLADLFVKLLSHAKRVLDKIDTLNLDSMIDEYRCHFSDCRSKKALRIKSIAEQKILLLLFGHNDRIGRCVGPTGPVLDNDPLHILYPRLSVCLDE